MNLRPSGYEPDELPGCSIPRQSECTEYAQSQKTATPKTDLSQINSGRLLSARWSRRRLLLRANLSSFPHGSNHEAIAPILSCVPSGSRLMRLRRSEEIAHLQPQNMRPRHTFRQKGICHPNRKDCSRKFDVLALFKKLMGLKQRFRQPSKKTGHANIHKARWRGIFT